MQVHPFHLNKVKPDPKGPTYFFGCCWHRKANFSKIGLMLLSGRVWFWSKLHAQNLSKLAIFHSAWNKIDTDLRLAAASAPAPIIKDHARPLSKIQIKLFGDQIKMRPDKNAILLCWKLLCPFYVSNIRWKFWSQKGVLSDPVWLC